MQRRKENDGGNVIYTRSQAAYTPSSHKLSQSTGWQKTVVHRHHKVLEWSDCNGKFLMTYCLLAKIPDAPNSQLTGQEYADYWVS